MKRHLLADQILIFAAIFGLFIISVKTTTFGFNLYLGGQFQLALIAALSVEVVLVSTCYILASKEFSSAVRAIAIIIFSLSAIISVSGSFLDFDQKIVRNDRNSRNTKALMNNYTKYYVTAIDALNYRKSLIDKELERIEQVKANEAESGFASHKGSGKGPMYKTLGTLSPSLLSLKTQLDKVLEDIKGMKTDPKNRENMMGGIRKVSSLIASAPPDQAILEELYIFYNILNRTKYGDVFTKPTISFQYPKMPSIQIARTGSKEELLEGSFNDLIDGNITSLMAMACAIIVDLLILLLSIVDSLLKRGSNNPNSIHKYEHRKGNSKYLHSDTDWVNAIDAIKTDEISQNTIQ